MKIIIIQDHLRSGGTERQSILLARAFTRAGHEAILITFRPGGELVSTASDIKRIVLQPFDTGFDWFAPGLFGKVRSLQPNIILCMGRMANCYAGGLQKYLPDCAVIGTMRTGKKLPWLYRRSLKTVRHIVANSHEAAHQIGGEHGIDARRISVIHNALAFMPEPPGTNPPFRDAYRGKYGAAPGTTVLLCVAMFRPEKNQRELIEIAAQLPPGLDWQLWLAGDGPTRPECEQLTAQKQLNERIKFLGFTANPTPLYHAANIAVLTSHSESLSNFLIEAHAHRVPSVAYRVSGLVECGGIIVEPGRQDEFLAALDTLMTDDQAYEAEADRVTTYACEHFSTGRQIAAYLDLFVRLTERSS